MEQIKEAVYLINDERYLHLRENGAGVGFATYNKVTGEPLESGQISEKNLPPDGQNTISAARNWYLFELSDDDRKAIQQESVKILENIPQAGIGRRRIWEPETLPKDIRLINSHYDDLYRIPDGGVIQVDYPDGRSFTARVEHLDDCHFDMGGLGNVFHICQFAEIMERNGATYMAEPEIMGDEAAWKVGRDRILAVQTCEDGYDYTLLDENYNEIDGGQLDNPDLTMIEARKEILESFGLERRELRVMVYEDVMEQAFEVGRQAVVVNDPIVELALKLDRLAENFDPYEYMDQVDDVQAHIQKIKTDLAAGNTALYREFLDTAIAESREETAVEVAKVLRSQLDKIDPPKRESVMEKLAQAAEKTAPATPSHKYKEPQR